MYLASSNQTTQPTIIPSYQQINVTYLLLFFLIFFFLLIPMIHDQNTKIYVKLPKKCSNYECHCVADLGDKLLKISKTWQFLQASKSQIMNWPFHWDSLPYFNFINYWQLLRVIVFFYGKGEGGGVESEVYSFLICIIYVTHINEPFGYWRLISSKIYWNSKFMKLDKNLFKFCPQNTYISLAKMQKGVTNKNTIALRILRFVISQKHGKTWLL